MIKVLSVLAVAATLTACGGGGGLDVAGESPTTQEVAMVPMAAATSVGMQATVKTAGGLISYGQRPSAIRTRYGFDALSAPSQQGAGQIIVIVTAYNNPNAGADLAKFSAQHGLAPCPTVKTQYVALPTGYYDAAITKPAVTEGCTFQTVNAMANGWAAAFSKYGVTTEQVPQYDTSGMWIAEGNMDIQWAHAIAPQAKIVLVQGPNNLISSLTGASKLAGRFADVISMSWGAYESSMTQTACTTSDFTLYPNCTITNKTQRALYGPANPVINGTINYTAGGWDTIAFGVPGVTYVAASGDAGAKPLWPAVSSNVLSVGGTATSGTTDTGWSYSGGGASLFYTSPSWQTVSNSAQRTTPDVAMAADSATPMSVYISPQTALPDTNCVASKGAANCGWYAGYGTSVSAPMWAGLAAVTNSVRISSGKTKSDFTAALYNVAAVQGNYVTAFTDVITGNNGTAAKAGYDTVTGLGVPNASALVGLLAQQ